MKFLTIAVLLLPILCSAVNVRDFGAAGDGITDDTAAIQAAFNAVKSQETFCCPGYSKEPLWWGHGGHGGYGKVYFPAGTYLVSETIVFDKRKIMIEGEEGTVIKQISQEKDVFYFDRILRCQIRNITFEGGARQLNFFTNNNDMTGIDIYNCLFKGSAKEAIYGETRTVNGKYTAPYNIVWNDETPSLTPVDLTGAGYGPYSTIFTIRECSFVNCFMVITGAGDTFLMENSSIFMGKNSSDTAMSFGGNINFCNVCAYWESNDLHGKKWIDLRGGIFSAEYLDFDNDGENGILLVNSSQKPGYLTSSFRLINSIVKCAGNEYGSIVRFAADTLPGIITISGITERSEGNVKAVSFEKEPSVDDIENVIRYQPWKSIPLKYFLKVKVAANSYNIDESLPESLEANRVRLIHHEIIAEAAVEKEDLSLIPSLLQFTAVQNAVVPDTGNARKAIQDALDNALPGTVVVLPAVNMIIDDTLRVPANIAVRGDGVPLLSMKEGIDKPIMEVCGTGTNLFVDLAFYGGSNAVVLSEGAENSALFENCGFYNQSQYSVAAPDMRFLKVQYCMFYTSGGVISEAQYTEIHANWICNTPAMENKGFFVNCKNNMCADFNLFVPVLPRTELGDGRKAIPEFADTPNGNNVRWFDNYGRLDIRTNRFGGEFQGMTPVWNFTEKGSVLMAGSMSWFGNHYVKNCMIYCVEVPELIVLNDIVFNAESRHEGNWNIWVLDKESGTDDKFPVEIPVEASALIMYGS